ncbi:MAG: DUF6807 family protein [Verrucomicrobiales bacterium]|nr:DUF6807 family protein [Verrucomicrobiales bacterium]
MRIGHLFVSALWVSLAFRADGASELVIDDPDGALAATGAPVAVTCKLPPDQRMAAAEGRLFVREVGRDPTAAVPAQILSVAGEADRTQMCWLLPPGAKGQRAFKPEILPNPATPRLSAERDTGGQIELRENGRGVLRYNYALIEPGPLLDQVTPANRIYARARSDYIHPLFGPGGETLTRDWPLDHPHHRGIYWAWPEVDWRGKRGDLHALQRVFARPLGRCFTSSGPVFAQVVAENLWKWDDAEPVVQERAVLRAYRASDAGRVIDVEFQFIALREPVLLARRGTDKYGGLNLRFAPVEEQHITTHTDSPAATPRMAWAEIAGRFDGAGAPCGVVIFQHTANPDSPGDWVQYPNLNWVQPTFPAGGTRWELRPGQPLVLRYRLWVHPGGPAPATECADRWKAYQSAHAPKFFPEPAVLKRQNAS